MASFEALMIKNDHGKTLSTSLVGIVGQELQSKFIQNRSRCGHSENGSWSTAELVRRLELFGRDRNLRDGWLTLGNGLTNDNWDKEALMKISGAPSGFMGLYQSWLPRPT